jgi:hypothetical protein
LAPLNGQILVDTFAGGQIPPGALGFVAGLTWDSAGNIIFCDTGYNVIRRLRPDGTVETIAGGAITGFSGDGGPATGALINFPMFPGYDASGNLYFLDAGNYRIRRIDTTGVITTIAGDGQILVPGLDTAGPAISIASLRFSVWASMDRATSTLLTLTTPRSGVSRLAALGVFRSGDSSLLPWTQRECLRIPHDGACSVFRRAETSRIS